MTAQNFLQSVNWANPSWDMMIALVFLVGSLLYGFSLGKDRLIVIIVSIYMALAFISNAPYLEKLMKLTESTVNQIFIFKITGFIGIFVILFFFLSRSALQRTIASRDEKGPWWQVIIFSILHVGLLISVILSFLPKQALDNLSILTHHIFIYDGARFAWLLAPIIAMILFKQKEAEKKE